MTEKRRASGWGSMAALAAILCLATGCPFHQAGSSASTASEASGGGATPGVKKLHPIGGGRGSPGLLEGESKSSREPESDLEPSHKHVPTPAFDWTDKTPGGGGIGGSGRHRRQG